ncbi:hypothetical protein HNQ02_000472 [Flavobacterium sp. 7E]|uniref:WG repeat-containing protein n=1 Tax=Flavobacterium sp. 7E TaxID=2735898 RepID=UPI00156F8282|nr:WG repeat-containing protein [Flavobacterium sp. 7E]NRS87565.1 hypothetical protein [Flavobacterium sp. 7E]
MRYIIYTLLLVLNFSCKSTDINWYLIENNDQQSKHSDVFGYTSGYVDYKGDTIILLDKYIRCFTDTVKHYAIVLNTKNELIGINRNEQKLFNAVWNGEGVPIGESDDMIMIMKNDKYGFANNKGEIIIEPKYKCAFSFNEGIAKVSNDCSKSDDEHFRWIMNTWILIDKKGNIIKKNTTANNGLQKWRNMW